MIACAACGAENPEGQRFCGSCAAALRGGASQRREQRKIITAVFCDVVGSTALGEASDPEAVRIVLARYFERMRWIVERHGGTVQKFIGDAVVAVFGVPVVHEDDALRALRAAEEMRDALPELGIEARIGVNTGEVVTSSDDTLVTGDAVNVAARLQQAAGSCEVLVGEATRLSVAGAVDVEALDALEVKGKAEPVVAYRLLAVGEAPERSHETVFVGRTAELELLRDAWSRVVTAGRCELVTVVGEPGVGKSRLAGELIAGLDARVVMGGCLSYGEGIGYRAVVEVVKQLGTRPADAYAAGVLGTLMGESETGTTPDEIGWAFRKLLEQEAPLLVLFDDIQWGDETFLDLVEQAGLLCAAPVLLLCLARPELEELRSRWPVAVRLEPLGEAEVEQLLPASLPAGLRERIARAAGGNPLFVTEMVAMAAEVDEEVTVPPTLRALLAARLDQLEAADRSVLERGAIEGEVFHRGAVQALGPAEEPVAPRLAALVRRELIRPDRPLLPGEEGFRFCHMLIREAAYAALPKAGRAELHERLSSWLAGQGTDLVERDETVAYHLEQAHRYRTEIGQPDEETQMLGERAAELLAAAGGRAAGRADYHRVTNLLERALAVGLRDQVERAHVQVELGYALYWSGRLTEADAVLAECFETASRLGEEGIAARALVRRTWQRVTGEPDSDYKEIERIAEEALATFERLGDQTGLVFASMLLGQALGRQGRDTAADARNERTLAYAEACGDRGLRRAAVISCCYRLCWRPTPVVDGIDRMEELLGSARDDRVLEAAIERFLSYLYAMAGRSDEALELVSESSRVLDELEQLDHWLFRWVVAEARELAADRPGAERELSAQVAYFRNLTPGVIDVRGIETGVRLAHFYCDDGRWDEAERALVYGRDVPLTSNRATAGRLAVEARLAAHRGRLAEARELAWRAVAAAGGAVAAAYPNARIWLAVAEVERATGDTSGARNATTKALELYEQKGNIAATAQLRARVATP
jgi:class 3 adenylate cyclase/tetratricopeptide (TPR) repeat protein